MAEFNIQSDSIDVTKVMAQIRQRIKEKRGADYTEDQIRELASVKLERILDPKQVRSDLVQHYQKLESPKGLDPIAQVAPIALPDAVPFDEETIYSSSPGLKGRLVRLLRRVMNPVLRIFLNPDPIIFAMARQAEINKLTIQLLQRQTDLVERVNQQFERVGKKFTAREDIDKLNFEVLNNLVVEMTRLAVDVKNHKMRVESVAGRLDFDERRNRALESVVQRQSAPAAGDDARSAEGGEEPRPRSRRRRRSRRRSGTPTNARPDATTAEGSGKSGAPSQASEHPSGSESSSADVTKAERGKSNESGAAEPPTVSASAEHSTPNAETPDNSAPRPNPPSNDQ